MNPTAAKVPASERPKLVQVTRLVSFITTTAELAKQVPVGITEFCVVSFEVFASINCSRVQVSRTKHRSPERFTTRESWSANLTSDRS